MSLLTKDLRTSLAEVSTPDTRLALRQMVDNLAQTAAGLKSATAAINTIREELFQDGKAMLVQIPKHRRGHRRPRQRRAPPDPTRGRACGR